MPTGAVNLTIHPNKYVGLSRAGLLASHSDSRSFADGDGYIPSEAVCVVLLKPLSDAHRDGDRVLAVIKGSQTNHGGHSGGYAVPSTQQQAKLIRDNFLSSGIDPRTVSYVEAAANGSPLGDTIELNALIQAFREFTDDVGFCRIGSVKSNMGHAEAASGMAQLTKVLLQFEHRQLVPSIKASRLNPNVKFDGTPFELQVTLQPWIRPVVNGVQMPRRATVSSFGAGGTNVHLILEQDTQTDYLAAQNASSSRPGQFIFSAQRPDRLKELISETHRVLLKHPDLSLFELEQTLEYSRDRFQCVVIIFAATRDELLHQLDAWGIDQYDPSTDFKVNSTFTHKFFKQTVLLPNYPFGKERYWLSDNTSVTQATGLPEVDLYSQTLNLISKQLLIHLGVDLGKESYASSFRSLGVDSMFSLRLSYTIKDVLNVEITYRDLEIYPTPEKLALYISQCIHTDFDRNKKVDHTHRQFLEQYGPIGLSSNQNGLWVMQNLYPQLSAYNIPLAFRASHYSQDALRATCRFMLEIFPILNTKVEQFGTEPVMRGLTHYDEILKITEIPKGLDEIDFVKLRVNQGFDLGTEIPIRFELLQSTDEIMLIVVHHVVFDGVSSLYFTNAFWDAYQSFSLGNQPIRCVPQHEYIEFFEWQKANLYSGSGKRQLSFWKNILSGDLETLNLPVDHQVGLTDTFISESVEFKLGIGRLRMVQGICLKLGVNPSVFYLGVLKILLYRYTGQQDIVVGMPAVARPDSRFESTIGYFSNILPIRSAISGSRRASEFFSALQSCVIDALDHSMFPHTALVRELGLTQKANYLYQVCFAYQNFLGKQSRDSIQMQNGEAITYVKEIRQGFDGLFGLDMYEESEDLRICANFNPAQFNTSTILRMLDHYQRLIDEICYLPDSCIREYEMISKFERNQLLKVWSHSGSFNFADGLVHEWIDKQAELTPEACAVVGRNTSLSYFDLKSRSDQLAMYLQQCNVKRAMPVAVIVRSGINSIVALLAVLKVGAIWLPLDPDSVANRLKLILDDSQAGAAIVDSDCENTLQHCTCIPDVVIHLDRDIAAIKKQHYFDKTVPVFPDNDAYVIYTSGTSGQPKGVVVSHRSLTHHCQVAMNFYGLNSQDIVLQFSAHYVDASLEQILPTLMCGARLVLRDGEIWSADDFIEVIQNHCLTVLDIPPAYLVEMLQARAKKVSREILLTPRIFIVGGDILSSSAVSLWNASEFTGAKLLNAYGPTEATITSLVHEVVPDDARRSVPIGKPLPGCFVFLLDRDGNPVPQGVKGELYIAGERLSAGYRSSVRLTEEKFLHLPFAQDQLPIAPEQLVYRTGDLASFISDSHGLIAFHGRNDEQIKIRGFRIELAEIQAAILDFGVKDAVVIYSPVAISTDPVLIACIVPGIVSMDIEALDMFLAERLPAYMCPGSFVLCESIPLTRGGKVDRLTISSLAKLNIENFKSVCLPRDDVEHRLALIWSRLLGFEINDIHLDFYKCGGHSLLALRLLAAINFEFKQSFNIGSLLKCSTISKQAQLLRVGSVAEVPSSLVLLAGDKNKSSPLFLVHPIGGDVHCYMSLAQGLGDRCPIYGLQDPVWTDGYKATSVEEIASSYLALIRKIQPSGPYSLAGWSFGGVVAFEMAQQLRLVNEQIQLLALIDSYSPELLINLGSTETPDFYKNLTVDIASDFEARISEAAVINNSALLRYSPKMYRGDLRLFYAIDHQPEDISLGWKDFVEGSLVIESLTGNHYSLLQTPNIQKLIFQLKELIGIESQVIE
jgi:amino acid adenylation domain-containing protein